MLQAHVKVGENGRVLIPVEMRKALGLAGNDEVVLEVDSGELRLMTVRRRLERAQEELAKHFAVGLRMSDELLLQRREEAAREAKDA